MNTSSSTIVASVIPLADPTSTKNTNAAIPQVNSKTKSQKVEPKPSASSTPKVESQLTLKEKERVSEPLVEPAKSHLNSTSYQSKHLMVQNIYSIALRRHPRVVAG